MPTAARAAHQPIKDRGELREKRWGTLKERRETRFARNYDCCLQPIGPSPNNHRWKQKPWKRMQACNYELADIRRMDYDKSEQAGHRHASN
jgi:hypothetical protein